MRIFKFIIFSIICLIVLVLALINSKPVILNYYFHSIELPLSILLAITLILGALPVLILHFFARIRFRLNNRVLLNRIKELELQLSQARPVMEDQEKPLVRE